MANTGEDRNFPRFRRGDSLSRGELKRIDELSRSLERATATGDAGMISQTGGGGFSIGWDSSPGYLGFAAIITGQDTTNPWMYSFQPLIEQPLNAFGPTPTWIGDNNFFVYPENTFNAMEGNFRVDVPWDRQPFIVLSNDATATANNVALTAGDPVKGFINFTGDTEAGSPDVLDLSSAYGLVAGQPVTGAGIPADTTISRVSLLGAIVWLVPNAVPDFFTFYLYERVMIIEITGSLITDSTQPGFGYYPAIEKIWNTQTLTWTNGDNIYFRDANQ